MFVNTKISSEESKEMALISSFISLEAIAFEASFTNEKLIAINSPLSSFGCII